MKNKKTINRVLKLIRPYTYLVVSILVLAAVTVAATLYSPILIGKGAGKNIRPGCMRWEKAQQRSGNIGTASWKTESSGVPI